MESTEVVFNKTEESHWCNYPIITKSNTGTSGAQKQRFSFTGSEELSPEVDERISITVKKSNLGTIQSACNSVILGLSKHLYPAEPIISPWLKFGVESDPWVENPKKKLPQLVETQRKKGSLTLEILASGLSNLTQLPDTKAFAVTKLELRDRGLTDIEHLSTYRCFQYIDISWNNIVDLYPLDNMVYLMCLNASHNRISSAIGMKAPWYLSYISLSCNNIYEINDLSEFWSLRSIDFSHNHISKIEGLHALKYLRHLNLSHNYINCLENLGGISSLEELDVSYNKISDWEENDFGMFNINVYIKMINVSYNCLQSLSIFEGLELRELYASHNQVSEVEKIDSIKNMKRLKKVSLEGNGISDLTLYIPILLHYLPQLDEIDGNKVTDEERTNTEQIFSPDLQLNLFRHHAKLLLYEQLSSSSSVGNDTLPAGEKTYPIVVLVGPHGSSKLYLSKRIGAEHGDYVYSSSNHLVSSKTQDVFAKVNGMESNTNYIVTEEVFNEMCRQGQFLATSDLLGFQYGFSRDELVKSIEEGKLCIICADLVMAFCLQALGLNPFLVLVFVKDVQLHQKRISEACTNPSKESFLDAEFDALITKHQSEFSKYDVGVNDGYNSIISEPRLADEVCAQNINDEYICLKKDSLNGKLSNCEYMIDVNNTNSSKQQKTSEILENNTRIHSNQENGTERSIAVINYDKKTENQTHFDYLQNVSQTGGYQNEDEISIETFNGQMRECETSSSSEDYTASATDSTLPPSLQDPRYHSRMSVFFGSTKKETPANEEFLARWSWTSSIDSNNGINDTLTTCVAKTKSSSSLATKTFSNVSQKILHSRNLYSTLEQRGFFSEVIYSDDIEAAYLKLKKIVHSVYNRKEDSICLYSCENDPFYEEFVSKRANKFMDELDKSESTALFMKK